MLGGVDIMCTHSVRCGTMHKSVSVLIGVDGGEFLVTREKVGDAIVSISGR